MKLVVDTNKIIACLLREGRVRKIFFNPCLEIYTHEYAIEEMNKNKDYFLKISERAFDFIFQKAISKLHLIKFSKEDYDLLLHAKDVAKNFDIDDYPFIALSLKLNIPIWTNDKELIIHGLKSGKYLALDTQSVENLFKGKSLEEIKKDLKTRYLSQ